MLESRGRMRGPHRCRSAASRRRRSVRRAVAARPPRWAGWRLGDAVGSSAAVRPGYSPLAAVTPRGVRARRFGALLAGRCIARGADRRAVRDGAGSMAACAPMPGRPGRRGWGGGGGGRAGWGTIGRGAPERHVDRAGDARRTGADRHRGRNRGCLQRRRGADRRGGHTQAAPRRAPTRSEGAGGGRPRRLYPCLADLACNSGEQPRGHPHRQRRTQGLQVGAPARDAGAKVPAGLAGAQVRAHPACPEDAPIALRKRSADLVALHLAPLSHLAQRQARLVHHLACRGLGGGERLRDLGVAQAAQLAHDQRDTLAVRQRVEVGDELAQALARFGPRVRRRLRRLRQRRIDDRGPAAQDRDRLVVGDAVEPRPQRDPPLARRAAPSGRPPSCSGARPAPRGDPPGLRGRSDRAPGDSAERSSRTRAGRPAVRGRPGARRRAASAEPAEIGAGRVPPPRQWPSP